MKKTETSEVCKVCECEESTAQKWAKENSVEGIGKGKKPVAYLWSEEDIARFQARPKPGKRAKKPNEKITAL